MRHLPSLPHERQIERHQDAEYVSFSRLDSEPASHFSDYIQLFKRRKWWVIIPFCLIIALGLLQAVFQTPLYTAKVTLFIDGLNPKIAPVQDILPPQTEPDFYNTQYQIIKGRTVVGKMVKQLHLDEQPLPEDPPVVRLLNTVKLALKQLLGSVIDTLKKLLGETPAPVSSTNPALDPAERRWLETVVSLQETIKVQPRLETKLVDVIIQGPDPLAVVTQVNTLAEIYIQENMDTKLEESRKATAWLQQEAETLRKKTDQAALTLERFKSGKDFLLADDMLRQGTAMQNNTPQSTALQRLSSLNTSYVEANTARLQLQTQIAELKRLSKRSIKEILEFPGIDENTFLRSLKTRFLESQLQHADISQRFGPKHPRHVEAKAALDEVTQSISREIQNMINQLEKTYNALVAKEGMLAKELDSQKTEVYGFSDDLRQYQALRRDLQVDQDLHLAVSKRYAEAALTEALTTNNIRIVERAIESEPVAQLVKVMALSLFFGVCLGAGLALMVEYFDKRFKTVDEVERYLALPCLGVIPHQRGNRRLKKPITLHAPGSRNAEAYRAVRSWLQHPTSQPLKSLMITSATPAEGKSTTAANLAVSFAQLGWNILLVDIDLRRPALHRAFGLANNQGLTDILVHEVDWRQVLLDTELENLKVLSAGFVPSNPVDLLSTRRMQAFMAQVTHTFDLVIFDAPMVLSLPEVAILAPHMDGVLLVHYPLRRDRDVLLQAKQSLDRRGAAVVGVVLNNVTEKAMSYYINYRYKGYHTPIVSQVTPDNGRTMQPIDMRPGANGRNWIPDPAPHPTPGTPASRIQHTAKSGDVALTIFTASLQQRLAEQASHPGYQFLVLDIELVNDATVPYTFHTEHTAVSITPQSEYSRALASLIEAPVRSSAEVPLLHGRQVYKYDAVSTRQLQEGLKEEETIAANGIMRGLLVYQIPLDAHNYVFEYSSDNSTFTIPLGKA